MLYSLRYSGENQKRKKVLVISFFQRGIYYIGNDYVRM